MRNKKTLTWNRLPCLRSQRGAPHPLHSAVSSYWHSCYILLKRSLRINHFSLLLLPSLFIVSFTDALMPNLPPPPPSVVLFLQLERECEKILKQQCSLHPVYHEGLQFSMERGAGNRGKKKEDVWVELHACFWQSTPTYHGTTLAEIRGPSWRSHRGWR